MRLFKLLPALFMLCVASCQHEGAIIQETPIGLGEIRRIVTTVIGDPRIVSSTGYELTSAYFDAKEKILERPNEAQERYYTIVNIHGDRRPYDVQVRVFLEVRTPEGYENIGLDEAMSLMVSDKIRAALHESRDKRNFIDDFKAF